jgi:hypothetical protein
MFKAALMESPRQSTDSQAGKSAAIPSSHPARTSRTKRGFKFGSPGQIGLALVLIVGLIAGITYVKQFQGDAPPPASERSGPGKAGQGPILQLDFPVKAKEWDPPSAGEFERKTDGHYDFWFNNPHAQALNLGVKNKSCRCAEVDICVLTDKEKIRYRHHALHSAASQLSFSNAGLTGLLPCLLLQEEQEPAVGGVKLRWEKMESDKSFLTVPAKGGGLVRFNWIGERTKDSNERLGVELWMQTNEERPSPQVMARLELPVSFVAPLRVEPHKFAMDEMSHGDERLADFMVWSSTRANFPLHVREQSDDPCITCTCTPLASAYCRILADTTKTRVLSGYRVLVRVRERVSEKQRMELGLFSRKIILSSSPDISPGTIMITGGVRGEIAIGTEEDKGRLRLGSYRSSLGTSKSLILQAEVPGLELKQEYIKVEPPELSYMQITLEKQPATQGDSRSRWRLLVSVPANGPIGVLPEHSAILLQVPGQPPRQIRIPVTGVATQ